MVRAPRCFGADLDRLPIFYTVQPAASGVQKSAGVLAYAGTRHVKLDNAMPDVRAYPSTCVRKYARTQAKAERTLKGRSRGIGAVSPTIAARRNVTSMRPPFTDMLSACDARWSKLNDAALRRAYIVTGDQGSWCLVCCWRPESSLDDNWEQHRVVVDGFRPTIDVQTLVAHFHSAPGSRTRFEPWMFIGRQDAKVRRWVAEWLMRRSPSLGFWGDGRATHVLTNGASRCVGDFRPCTIAHVFRESSPQNAAFLGFDYPTPHLTEALARTLYVGALR